MSVCVRVCLLAGSRRGWHVRAAFRRDGIQVNATKIRKLVSRAERSIAKNRKGAEQKQNRAEGRGRKEKSKEKNRAEVQN